MLRIKTQELTEGMVVASDVYMTGVRFPLARRGLILSAEHINKLKNHGVAFVYIEQTENYKGLPGQTLTLSSIDSDIGFNGRVEVKGNVPANTSIDAGESVVIEGDVGDGCRIFSRSGAIVIRGFVYGTGENPLHLQAKQNISVGNVANATVKTEGEFTTEGDIIDTVVNAKGEVKVSGRVIRSQINTNMRMILGECGNKECEPCALSVSPLEFQETMQELLKTDSVIAGLSKEKAQLQNIIDLIKKLGSNVENLPQDKKVELAKGVKRFKDITAEISVLSAKKVDLGEKLKEIMGIRRIIINREIYPNVKVQMGNKIFAVTAKEQRVAFCVRENTMVMEILT
jgi:uncharacterized protein (DUF342 family)